VLAQVALAQAPQTSLESTKAKINAANKAAKIAAKGKKNASRIVPPNIVGHMYDFVIETYAAVDRHKELVRQRAHQRRRLRLPVGRDPADVAQAEPRRLRQA